MDDLKSLSDEENASLAQKGNKDAYEKLVIKYEPKIRRYITYLLGSSDNLDDIIQETFISAYLNINSFNLSKKFSSWIYRISHNKAMDFVRKESKTRINIDFDFFDNFLASNETPEDSYKKEELSESIKTCLTSLPFKYREILTLYYLEDKSYDEMRDILQINVNNISVRLNRGKRLLKNICSKGGINA